MGSEQSRPSDEEFQKKYYFQKGEEQKRQGSWDAALSEFRKALQLEPRSSPILVRIGQAYQGKGEQEREPAFMKLAWHHYQEAVSADPSHTEAHDALIALAVKLKRYDELIADYKQKLGQNPDNPVLAASLKKLQTLSLMAIPDASQGGADKTNLFKRVVLDVLLPFIGVLAVVLSVLVKNYYTESRVAPFAPRIGAAGWAVLGCFALYKFLSFQTAKKQSQQW